MPPRPPSPRGRSHDPGGDDRRIRPLRRRARWAAAPRRDRSAGSSASRTIAAASASGSRGGTMRPLSPSATTSSTRWRSATTDGTPSIAASMTLRPGPSWWLGKTRMSLERRSGPASSRWPTSSTVAGETVDPHVVAKGGLDVRDEPGDVRHATLERAMERRRPAVRSRDHELDVAAAPRSRSAAATRSQMPFAGASAGEVDRPGCPHAPSRRSSDGGLAPAAGRSTPASGLCTTSDAVIGAQGASDAVVDGDDAVDIAAG